MTGDALAPIELSDSPIPLRTSTNPLSSGLRVAEAAKDIANKKQRLRDSLKSSFHARAPSVFARARLKPN